MQRQRRSDDDDPSLLRPRPQARYNAAKDTHYIYWVPTKASWGRGWAVLRGRGVKGRGRVEEA